MEARKTKPADSTDVAVALTAVATKIAAMDSRMATKADLELLATKADLQALAAKVAALDARMATKADKADLEPLATKAHVDTAINTAINTANAALLTQIGQWFANINARLDQFRPPT